MSAQRLPGNLLHGTAAVARPGRSHSRACSTRTRCAAIRSPQPVQRAFELVFVGPVHRSRELEPAFLRGADLYAIRQHSRVGDARREAAEGRAEVVRHAGIDQTRLYFSLRLMGRKSSDSMSPAALRVTTCGWFMINSGRCRAMRATSTPSSMRLVKLVSDQSTVQRRPGIACGNQSKPTEIVSEYSFLRSVLYTCRTTAPKGSSNSVGPLGW